jgi:hypothetical protein
MKPRNSWDYVTTVTVPCPECTKFIPEADCKLRSEYVYGEGYIKLQCCAPCFDAKVKALKANVKESNPYVWG